MAITLREVAKLAGVSAMTVSRVINNAAGVRTETKRRVEEVIAELDYVPNRVARGLTSSKTGIFGLIVPDVVNPFFTLVVRGAETVARRAGYRVLLCNSEADLALERQYIDDMISHRIEGLLIAPVGDRSRTSLLPLVRRGFPFVLIDRSVARLDCDLVQADSMAGAREMVEHLIDVGHRRIAFIMGTDDMSTSRERLQGYREALAAGGIDFVPELVFVTTVDRIGGYRAMQQVLRIERRPSAVFAVNNMTALGAMQAIREEALTVPEDIALVCFDDVEHLAVLSPFLTVMDQPADAFGTIAVQLLLERIAGQAGDRPRVVRMKPNLILRESCRNRLAAGRLPPAKQGS
jgi:LacI family transcriptional regulator